MNVETFEEVTQSSIPDPHATGYDPDHKIEEKCCNWMNLMHERQA